MCASLAKLKTNESFGLFEWNRPDEMTVSLKNALITHDFSLMIRYCKLENRAISVCMFCLTQNKLLLAVGTLKGDHTARYILTSWKLFGCDAVLETGTKSDLSPILSFCSIIHQNKMRVIIIQTCAVWQQAGSHVVRDYALCWKTRISFYELRSHEMWWHTTKRCVTPHITATLSVETLKHSTGLRSDAVKELYY